MVITRPPPPIGRGEIVAEAAVRLAAGESVLLYGPAGIGKSTILDAIVADAAPALVLRAGAAEAEAELPYLTLVDLFDGALDERPEALPSHLRAALDGALLRSALPSTPHDQLAVRLAVLELLRALAARRPVLVVLDDAQWIDDRSAAVLRFVARRLSGIDVRVLAAQRTVDGAGAAPDVVELCPSPRMELAVPPLDETAIADLVRARFGPAVCRSRLRRLYEASDGNPLFAVELGRALVDRGDGGSPTDPLPVPARLRDLLSVRSAGLAGSGRATLLVAAAGTRPSRSLLERCGIDVDTELADAVAAGVVAVDPDGPDAVVRFSHPLLREMVYADAEPAHRCEAHRRLASALSDPVARARHLAHAHPEPNEALGRTLANAASVARLRAAPAVAADLAALAAERTLPDPPGLAAARRLAAAEYAYAAGSAPDARRHADIALRDAPDRRTRVRARLLLAELAGRDHSRLVPLLDAALADALETPDLLAHVRLRRGVKAYRDGDMEAALSELKWAEEIAEQCGDTERLVEVLSWQGAALGGRDGDELLERAGELARGLPLMAATVGARRRSVVGLLLRGGVAEAVRRIEALRSAVQRSGTVHDLAGVLRVAAVAYLRAGRCAEALEAGRSCARLDADIGTTPGPGLLVAAASELSGGSIAQALAYAERAIQGCRAVGDEAWLRAAYATVGTAHLLGGDPLGAVDPLRQAWLLEQRIGRLDPLLLLWPADFVEALVVTGAKAEAREVLGEVRGMVDRLDRRVVQLSLARAAAVLTAGTDPRAGADQLRAGLDRWAEHPYPLEVARAWFTLGVLERRAHRRGAARAALAEAVRRYAAAGAVPWREVAAAELTRLDGGRGAGLSDTERRIVELVRAGATNREIAGALFLSVKAVEANLTRMYRRLGVRNRAQLARSLETGD